MSGPAAVLGVVALLALCGLGVLAILGVGTSLPTLLRRSGLAPLAGMAWAGIAGATLAAAGSRLSLAGLALLTFATCAAGAVRLAVSGPSTAVHRRASSSKPELPVVFTAIVLVAIVGTAVVAALWVKPLVEYDGWAIWGMKARAISVLGAADEDLFASEAYARLHNEYPLLLPSLHALPLQATDGFSSNTVVLASLAIGAAGLLAIWALFRDRVRPMLLLTFVAAMAATPAFSIQLGTGYADVPLALFVACGLGAAARWLVDRSTAWLALATLFLAAAALTKNEGLLFAAAVYLSLFLCAHGRRRAVAASALVVALLFAPWRAYIAVHDLGAPDYDLSTSFNLPWVAGRLDRAPAATLGLLAEAVDPEQFGVLLILGAAAALLAVRSGPRPLGVLAAGFGLLSLAGLTWIYVLTPNEVDDYLKSNGNRIVFSLVLGLATLAPLLIEEYSRPLDHPQR